MISRPAPRLTGSLPRSVRSLARSPPPRRRHRGTRGYRSHRPRPRRVSHVLLGRHDLADQGRDDVRGARVEVVAGPIEVDREQVDRVEAILLAVGLRLHQQDLFGQPVGGVGLLRVAVPEVVLMEGDGCELWVGADRADGAEFLDASEARFLHQLGAHHQVVGEEGAGVFPVEADAAHPSREMNHGVGALDDLAAAVALDQVEALRTRDEDIRSAALAQPIDHPGAEESGSSGDDEATPSAHFLPFAR